jgi:hypothetical protein
MTALAWTIEGNPFQPRRFADDDGGIPRQLFRNLVGRLDLTEAKQRRLIR